jgi:hypothetical protein
MQEIVANEEQRILLTERYGQERGLIDNPSSQQ